MILDIGCGHLSTHRRREGIGIDLHRGTCHVVADAHYLPFRTGYFSKIFARNILEHLEDPMLALKEAERVLKGDGAISITIPIFHNLCVDELVKIMFGFPLRLVQTVTRLKGWRRHRFEKGFWHRNRVKPEDISRVFIVKRLCQIRSKHDFCYGRKGKLLRKLGLPTLFYQPDVNYVYAIKEKTHCTSPLV